ncbi:hypothetical protein U1Q18_031276 [Sarracenia purpurea var. burkii]
MINSWRYTAVPVLPIQRPDGMLAPSYSWMQTTARYDDICSEHGIPTMITWCYDEKEVSVEEIGEGFRHFESASIRRIPRFIVDGQWRPASKPQGEPSQPPKASATIPPTQGPQAPAAQAPKPTASVQKPAVPIPAASAPATPVPSPVV